MIVSEPQGYQKLKRIEIAAEIMSTHVNAVCIPEDMDKFGDPSAMLDQAINMASLHGHNVLNYN